MQAPTTETLRVWEYLQAIREDDPEHWEMWREDAQFGPAMIVSEVAGIIGLEDAPTPLAAEILADYLARVDLRWLCAAILADGTPAA